MTKHILILCSLAVVFGCTKPAEIDYPDPASFPTGESHPHDKKEDPDAILDTPPSSDSYITNGCLPGSFAISSNTQVRFSMGNLQYNAAQNIWRFAPLQYTVIGDANMNISSTYDGFIDLFGWGTSGYNGCYPYLTTTDNEKYGGGLSDIAGTEYDWGLHNPISNGGNKKAQWRCLSAEEWDYLFMNNPIGFGSVKGIKGLFIIPKNWMCPNHINFTEAEGLAVSPFLYDHSLHKLSSSRDMTGDNVFTQKQWMWLESSGVLFLPFTKSRIRWLMTNLHSYHSTSSIQHCADDVACVRLSSNGISYGGHGDPKEGGCAVRLVKL